jgi:iron(III) transport system substrate-binding protein
MSTRIGWLTSMLCGAVVGAALLARVGTSVAEQPPPPPQAGPAPPPAAAAPAAAIAAPAKAAPPNMEPAGETPVAAPAPAAAAAPPPLPLTIFSSFDPGRMAALVAAITRETGIEITLVNDDDDLLLGRLLREGAKSRADVVLLRNGARFERAATAGLLQAVKLPAVEQAVPARFRDADVRWFGLASFARVLVYAPDRVKPGELASYDSPTALAWRGRLCLPPPHHPGYRTLLAGIITHHGVDYGEAWARGMLANAAPPLDIAPPLQRTPEWIDRSMVDALDAKACDITLLDSRTLTRFTDPANTTERRELDRVAAVWPNQDGWGTQVDIIGAGMAAASEKRESVQKLFEYLVSDAAQRAIAEALHAYPIKGGVPLTDALTRWGPFKADDTPLPEILSHLEEARTIADKVGWP